MNPTSLPIVIIGAGQSGLAAADAVRAAGLRPIILEAGARAAGSWPHYYDSLKAFSPRRFNALTGIDFPGDPDAYPGRDEVADYLMRFAARLDVEIRTETAVVSVAPDGPGFSIATADGDTVAAAGVVAATGSFGNPHRPVFPGQEAFTGSIRHVADYREPTAYKGQRVLVVGGGNSAVQVAYELAEGATVTVASRQPVSFTPQRVNGQDVHHLLTAGFDALPPEWLAKLLSGGLVLDTGDYQNALRSGAFDRRDMFTRFDGGDVVWPDGEREPVDAVILATGYRPNLGYLDDTGALDGNGLPRHVGGISTTHPGLVYVGLEMQRSFASNTLRGVHEDARYVVGALAGYAGGAAAAFSG